MVLKIKSIIIGLVFAFATFAFTAYSTDDQLLIKYDCNTNILTVNENEYQSYEIQRNGDIFIPIDDVLRASGYNLGWSDEERAVIALYRDKNIHIFVNSNTVRINDIYITAKNATFIENNIMYIPVSTFNLFSESAINIIGNTVGYRDLLADTEVNDYFRLENSNVYEYGKIAMVGAQAIELISIDDYAAAQYALKVNSLSSVVPENVNIYNIVVPNSAEYYAPLQLYTNQLSGIRKVYSHLDTRVIPINAVRPLMEHAGEKIYFNSDHHWTQRGAYYVYREFAKISGIDLPYLESFNVSNTIIRDGSMQKLLAGTSAVPILKSSPELLERFVPTTATNGVAYSDMYMTKPYYYPGVINYDKNNYTTFMGGDCPVAKFVTSVKNGRKICIVKESYGLAFATWALNNYEEVYLVDPREFNDFAGHENKFSLREFQRITGFTDLVIINYPSSVSADDYRTALGKMAY